MDCLTFRRPGLWIFVFMFSMFSHSRGNETHKGTAKVALALLKIERGSEVAANITHVRGHRGQDQPISWEVSSRVADGERVFVIRHERIIADTIYSSGGGISIDLRRLRADSSEIFKIANREAELANVGFDSLDYELLAAPLGNTPLWIVFLRDHKGRDVGRIEVSGESSRVLRSQWFAPRASSRQPIGPDDSDRKTVLRSYTPRPVTNDSDPDTTTPVKTFAVEAGRKLKSGLLTVGNRLSRVFARQENVSTERPRYYPPATSRKRKSTR